MTISTPVTAKRIGEGDTVRFLYGPRQGTTAVVTGLQYSPPVGIRGCDLSATLKLPDGGRSSAWVDCLERVWGMTL